MKKKKKPNCCNVLKFEIYSWKPKYWLRNIIQFFRNFKFAKQRITRGYASCDVWNLDDYLTGLLADTIRTLSEMVHGYPGTGDFDGEDGYEKWVAYLREISNKFQYAYDEHEDENEYYEDWRKHLREPMPKDGIIRIDKVSEKYFARDREIREKQEKELKEAFEKMLAVYHSLWD